jgi:WD40 repeat protein
MEEFVNLILPICACAQVTALAMSPDGRALYSGDEDGALCAWDLDAAKRLWDAPAAHSGAVWSLAPSHGAGAILASGVHLPPSGPLSPQTCGSSALQLSLCEFPGGL